MFVAEIFVVLPSPKFQKRLVIVPVEASLKFTINGHAPVVGLPVNPADGMNAPMPLTGLTALPPFAVLKLTLLLKLPALVGVNRTTTFVAPKPGRSNGVPDTMVNGPLVKLTTPLLTAPVLVTTKVNCALVPTAMVPKFRLAGDTLICPGV